LSSGDRYLVRKYYNVGIEHQDAPRCCTLARYNARCSFLLSTCSVSQNFAARIAHTKAEGSAQFAISSSRVWAIIFRADA